MDELAEAHAPEAFLDRVRSLEQGEVARLEGGVAVKRLALEDGRDAYRVARPTSWRRGGELDFDGGEHWRTPEDATKEAFIRSAHSNDPDSIGGATRLYTHGAWEVDGEAGQHRIQSFTTDGKAIVSAANGAGTQKVHASKLKRPVTSGLLETLHERAQERAALRGEAAAQVTERELADATWALMLAEGLLGDDLAESAKTAGYAVTHASRGKGGTNWITKDKPGNSGQLPAYIQNVRNGIVKSGKTLGEATGIAISRIRAWAKGGGNVGPEVKAAAAKALAEYDAMRARARGKSTIKESTTMPMNDDAFWLREQDEAGLAEAFDESKFRRDLLGRFSTKVDKAKVGDTFALTPEVSVKRTGESTYDLKTPDGTQSLRDETIASAVARAGVKHSNPNDLDPDFKERQRRKRVLQGATKDPSLGAQHAIRDMTPAQLDAAWKRHNAKKGGGK